MLEDGRTEALGSCETVIYQAADERDEGAAVSEELRRYGLDLKGRSQFTNRTSRLDWHPIYVFERR